MREPFKIAVPDDVLDDLQNRLANTRLPPDAGAAGWNDGVEPAYLAGLIAYWRAGYDWRAQEHNLNQFHHFRASVDGTRLHFIHERGAGPSPMPLVEPVTRDTLPARERPVVIPVVIVGCLTARFMDSTLRSCCHISHGGSAA